MEQCVQEVLKESREIKHHLVRFNYFVRMDTADISHFFPLKSNHDLKRFMEQDEEWNQRRKERSIYYKYYTFNKISVTFGRVNSTKVFKTFFS